MIYSFEIPLLVLILVTAAGALLVKDLISAVLILGSYSFLLALVWAWLGAVDVAFILDAYHHFEQPIETMRAIADSLKADGRLVVVDFYRSRVREGRDPDWALNHIRADRDEFRAELEAAGVKFVRTFDHLPHQYALIFEKASR